MLLKIPINAYGDLCSLTYDLRLSYASKSEVDFFVSYIDKNPGRVLEAMSGSGRLLIPMAQRGYCVDGVDYSPSMLARCRARCAQQNLAPELYEQSLEFLVLPHTYATVIIALGSFQLMYDRTLAVQSLKKLHAHMFADGNLLIDIFEPVTTDVPTIQMISIDVHTQLRMSKKYNFDHNKQIAQVLCTYELMLYGIVQKIEEEMLQIVWYSDQQWSQLLADAGFKIITIHNNPYGQDEASRLIHAQKI